MKRARKFILPNGERCFTQSNDYSEFRLTIREK